MVLCFASSLRGRFLGFFFQAAELNDGFHIDDVPEPTAITNFDINNSEFLEVAKLTPTRAIPPA